MNGKIKVIVIIILLLIVSSLSYTDEITYTRETVTIYRDIYGVPHIYAETNEGVMYGFGYAQAQDHLKEMIHSYIRASGRLCEFFGVDDPMTPENDYNYFTSDLLMRLCKTREIAEERYNEIDPQVRALLEAFAQGINLYIAENATSLPWWVLANTPMTGVDAVTRTRWFMLLHQIDLARKELFRMNKITMNSNQWVVDENKTTNGYVMLQIDPHIPWSIENRLYEAHLVGGDINMIGATSFGSPFLSIGHTDIFAMAITSNYPDVADVYIETLDETNRKYLFETQWYDITIEPDTIKILNSNPVIIPRMYTHAGERIIFSIDRVNHIAYSVRLVSKDEVLFMEQAFEISKAKNLTEFKEAFSMGYLPIWNICYGDIYGNIYYLYNARQPLKSLDYDWTAPVDGSIKETEWTGWMQFQDLPQVENPISNYLINCNVVPWLVTENSGIDSTVYPPYLFQRKPDGSGGAGNTFRQLRAQDLISIDSNLTYEEMKDAAFDSYLITAERAKLLIQASVNDPVARSMVSDPLALIDPAWQILDAWDNRADKDRTGTALFTIFYEIIPGGLPIDTIIDPSSLRLQDKVYILNMLVQAATWMFNMYGQLDIVWGDIHKIKKGEETLSVGGSNKKGQALRLANAKEIIDGEGYCDEGSAYMMLVILSQPIQAFSAKPHGQSQDPNSTHFSDLTQLYCNDEFKPAWFTLDDILNNLESTTILIYP